MAVIITTDVERAARRTDKTLQLGQGDLVGPQARDLAARLGVRIAGPDEPVGPPVAEASIQSATPLSAAVPAPPNLPPILPPVVALDPLPNIPPIRVEPASVPPAVPPAVPLERYGAGMVLDRVETVGRSLPERAAPPPTVTSLVAMPEPPPPLAPPPAPRMPEARPSDAPSVQRIPLARPLSPEPARTAPAPLPAVAPPPLTSVEPLPAASAPAATQNRATLFSSGRPPSWRQRRQVVRAGAADSQLGIILGRVVGSREVARAAEAGVRLVRIGPEAYVTRSARHAAAQLGVVLYPDTSLIDVRDRTKAGAVVNPISLEPAITRQGAGMMHTSGIPIGGDHLSGTLDD